MLSIPFVSRNDDHGGELLTRIQVSLNAIVYYWQKYEWDIEVIFVEWNPRDGQILIRDILHYPDNFPIRFIEVPQEIHDQFTNSEKIPLFSATAMNVAIRRAKGNWAVSTTHDDIFSPELVSLLKNENFSENSYYRAARYDTEVDAALPISQLVDSLETGVVKRNDPGGPGLFTKAAGDFILMSIGNWDKIQGYPEWPLLGFYYDGIVVSNAYAIGLQQVVYPYSVYHVEHGNGGHGRLRHLPHISGKLWNKIRDNAWNKKRSYPLDNPNWGLGDCKEVQLAKNVVRLEGGSPPRNIIPS